MMKKPFNPESFQRSIAGIPPEKRFIKKQEDFFDGLFCKNSCVFGMPTSVEFETLTYLPDETKGLYFYLGADIEDVWSEIKNSDITNHLEYLTIGLTKGNEYRFSDYNKISTILSGIHFPKLKYFEYGVDFLLANEHCLYGNLGNITGALANMPNLETLELFGNFQIDRQLHFLKLTRLEVLMNDWVTNINGGRISNQTIQHLLSSHFEKLELLSLNLDFNDDIFEYSLPDQFLAGENIKTLKQFELKGNFVRGTKAKLANSRFIRENVTGLDIGDITEEN